MVPLSSVDRTYIRSQIINLRNTRKLSQDEFAVQLGITREALSRYECGHQDPSLAIILRLCDVYNVPITSILPPRVCDDTILPSAYYSLPAHVQACVRAAIDTTVNLAITAADKDRA